VDQVRIFIILKDAKPIDSAGVWGNVSVPEIKPEQISVRRLRKIPDISAELATLVRAPAPIRPSDQGLVEPFRHPIPDRGPGDAHPAGCLGDGETLVQQVPDRYDVLFGSCHRLQV